MLNIQLQYLQFYFQNILVKFKSKLVNLINLDKYNAKYLAPIFPILFLKYFDNLKFKLVNLINLDKANAKYLASIYPILFYIIF